MKHRPANIPMMRETRERIALTLHGLVNAMLIAPNYEAMNEMAKHMAIMTAAIDNQSNSPISRRTDAPARAVVACLGAMEAISKRYQDTQQVYLRESERDALRLAATQFDAVLARIPYNVYAAARIFVENALGHNSAA